MKSFKYLFFAIGALLLLEATMTPRALAQAPVTPKYATDSQVEANFRGQSFLLVGDDAVAQIRGLDWSPDRTMSLPFWLGTGTAAPQSLSPKRVNTM